MIVMKITSLLLRGIECLMIAPGSVHAATDAQAVLLLRTYHSATSTDEPCLPAGPTAAEVPTLCLSCPSPVRVEALANEAAGWHWSISNWPPARSC